MNTAAYKQLKDRLDEREVTLVAISKTKPIEDIQALYNEGHRIFGENRAKELQEKHEQLPKDIEWHMVGHLQSNKVKYIAPFVSVIQSVDSVALLEEIDKLAAQNNRTINVLLQVHIAKEKSKYGFQGQEIIDLAITNVFSHLKHIQIQGLMGMATLTNKKNQIRSEFSYLKGIFDQLKDSVFSSNEEFKTLSMGMSNDYKVAIKQGANMVRIGSLLFGERN